MLLWMFHKTHQIPVPSESTESDAVQGCDDVTTATYQVVMKHTQTRCGRSILSGCYNN